MAGSNRESGGGTEWGDREARKKESEGNIKLFVQENLTGEKERDDAVGTLRALNLRIEQHNRDYTRTITHGEDDAVIMTPVVEVDCSVDGKEYLISVYEAYTGGPLKWGTGPADLGEEARKSKKVKTE